MRYGVGKRRSHRLSVKGRRPGHKSWFTPVKGKHIVFLIKHDSILCIDGPEGEKEQNDDCLFQRLAVLMNDSQVVRYPSISENESVSNIVSRDISLVNSIFDGPPRSHECKNRWIPFFENWLEFGQERGKFLNILRVVWADSVNQK